ncbi:MAG: cysteine--tRNA ligase [Candidatus Eiseniibacteriota bacterium]
MSLRLYDTLTREKRPFEPVQPGRAGIYVCGMTVQDKPHVGHIRSSIVGDTVRRWLEHLGYEVAYVYNFTDVDDKIIGRANEEGLTFKEVAQRNIDAYLHYADLHNVKRATVYPRATEHIPEMLDLIGALEKDGIAYRADGDVFYEVRKRSDYGKLSGRNVDDMRAGSRIEVDEAKRDALDFALWKGAKPGEPAWETPYGPGRPGWHIECSAMSMKYLGATLDIHGGGQDLIFPHHENEIAQSEAATGKPFAHFWVHNGMVNLAGEKMSKSAKLYFLIEDIASDFEPELVRFYLSSTHYRSPIEFSLERLTEARTAYARIRQPMDRFGGFDPEPAGAAPASGAMADAIAEATQRFDEAMNDDVNTAKALGHLFDLAREVNRAGEAGDPEPARAGARTLRSLGARIGLFWTPPRTEEPSWPAEVVELVARREAARKARNFKESDELRDALKRLGVTVEDSPDGPRIKPLG